MPLTVFRSCLIASLLWLAAPATAQDCRDQTPCVLGERSYHLRLPDDWDGTSAMPVLLHFHGWGRQGTLIVKHTRIAGATAPRGVLLLAPNGQGRTWNFWNAGSRDVDFAAAVIEDAARQYPIDRSRIYVSGYSFGSAMAWRYVCDNGAAVRALMAVSGTLDQSEDCTSHPQEVRHVHGVKDTVMRFPFGAEGDTLNPVALWRRKMGCSAPTGTSQYATTQRDRFDRTIWASCDAGQAVRIDVHQRGHFIPRGWFAKQLDELLADGAG